MINRGNYKAWSMIGWALVASGLVVLGLSVWLGWITFAIPIAMLVACFGLVVLVIAWLSRTPETETLWSIASHSSEHPTPRDVYLFLLSKTEMMIGEGYAIADVTFLLEEDKSAFVQIDLDKEGSTLLNFANPGCEEPVALMARLEISLPEGYQVMSTPHVHEHGTATFGWSTFLPHQQLADIADALFTKLLGATPDYHIHGKVWVQK
jgi:hypothetical protein